MPSRADEFLVACELHSAERLAALLEQGFEPRKPVGGKLPIDWLVEMYTRSDAFPACLRLLLDQGAALADPGLAAVLLDDPAAIRQAAANDAGFLRRRVALGSAFTPLTGVSVLHVAAEYGHLAAARTLLELGVEVDARADRDADGLGGHTPLFHTVCSHANRSQPVMRLLLAAGADPAARIDGLVWGKGCEWETVLFDLTPISYAQLGTLPQMHRREEDVVANLRLLLAAAGRPVPDLGNVPNRYAAQG